MKYAKIERERRFLLAAPPPGLAAAHREIEDLYFPGTTLRLRAVRTPDGAPIEWKLGQKLRGPGGPAERVMTSVYLARGEYELLARLPGLRLHKRRHVQVEGGVAFSVDVFLGPLAGLVLAEKEAGSDASLHAIAMPSFACCEVTELASFTGGALASADPEVVLREARERIARGRASTC